MTMILDRIRRNEVLLPNNHNYYNFFSLQFVLYHFLIPLLFFCFLSLLFGQLWKIRLYVTFLLQFESLLGISFIYFVDLKVADGTFQWNKKEYFPYGTSTPRFKGPKFNSLFFFDIWVLLIKFSLCFAFLLSIFCFFFLFIWLRVPRPDY